MQIKKLEKQLHNPTFNWGHNGYSTDKIFSVSLIEYAGCFEFNLKEKSQHYTKNWETNADDLVALNKIIEKGSSVGAYINDELIGWMICEHRIWNNSFYIENIAVDQRFRRQGAGTTLIKAAIREARILNCRIIELETQNTNYPAIEFYKKTGFSITGLNTKLYENSSETALFMSMDV